MKYKEGDKIEYQGCIFKIRKASTTQYLLEFVAVVDLATAFNHLMMGWEDAEYVDNSSVSH